MEPTTQDDWLADPQYRAAVVDLLGALAYGELTAFNRLAGDAELAPTQPLQGGDGRPGRHRVPPLRACCVAPPGASIGVDPEAAMAPFVGPSTPSTSAPGPSDWLEGLVKAYVGDGIAKDFYREISAYVDAATRRRWSARARGRRAVRVRRRGRARGDQGRPARRRPARPVGPPAGRRGALQAQRVAVERDALASLLVGGVRTGRCRPGRARPDVRPAHRRAHPPDGPPRPVGLEPDAVCRRLARTAGTPSWRAGRRPRTDRWACAGHAGTKGAVPWTAPFAWSRG